MNLLCTNHILDIFYSLLHGFLQPFANEVSHLLDLLIVVNRSASVFIQDFEVLIKGDHPQLNLVGCVLEQVFVLLEVRIEIIEISLSLLLLVDQFTDLLVNSWDQRYLSSV